MELIEGLTFKRLAEELRAREQRCRSSRWWRLREDAARPARGPRRHRPRRRPRHRRRAPRRVAPQRDGRRGWTREGHRLRPGDVGGEADRHRVGSGARQDRVHGARAGARRAGHGGHPPVRGGHRALRARHRRALLRRHGQPGHLERRRRRPTPPPRSRARTHGGAHRPRAGADRGAEEAVPVVRGVRGRAGAGAAGGDAARHHDAARRPRRRAVGPRAGHRRSRPRAAGRPPARAGSPGTPPTAPPLPASTRGERARAPPARRRGARSPPPPSPASARLGSPAAWSSRPAAGPTARRPSRRRPTRRHQHDHDHRADGQRVDRRADEQRVDRRLAVRDRTGAGEDGPARAARSS